MSNEALIASVVVSAAVLTFIWYIVSGDCLAFESAQVMCEVL